MQTLMDFIDNKILILSGIVVFYLACSPSVYAQKEKRDFEKLNITLNYVSNTNRDTFHEYWKSSGGIEALVESPFYYGNIQSGIHISQFSSKQPDIPDFSSMFIYLGWGKDVIHPFNLIWFNGFRVGMFYMYFNEDEVNDNMKSENELGFSLESRLQHQIMKNWFINLSGYYTAIFTHKRIYHTYIAIGSGYSFTTPKWLREFLE
jgi:hypothetical protein